MTEPRRNATSKKPGTLRTCPLCGARFFEDEMRCAGCPMHKSCSVLCCPACGYSFVTESRIAGAIKRVWKRRKT